MKRVLSVLLFLVILFSISPFSFAATLETYNWADVKDDVYEIFGDDSSFVPLEEVEAEFWLPNIYVPEELSEDDLANDGIASYMSSSGDSFIFISYLDLPGVTLDSFLNYYSQKGSPVEMITVNGIPAVVEIDEASDIALVFFETRDGKILQFVFYPMTDTNYSSVFGVILSSIQPVNENVEPVSSSNPVSGLIKK